MTFNIRRPLGAYRRAAPDAWFTRAPAVQAVLRAHRPQLAALQEVLPEQLHPVQAALGPDHVLLGTGRDGGGRGERCLLSVDTARFGIERWEQRWLSPQPEVPGSRWPGDLFPRTLVLADLVDRRTGVAWRAVATHLDPWPEHSRLRQLAVLQRLLLGRDGPLLLLGDMNAAAGRSRTWDAALAGGLRDTLPPDAAGTFPRYREPRAGAPRLDWILYGGRVRVLGSRVLAERPRGVWASDHFPVLAEVELDDGPGA
ncbi:endonuclease/exonuclease/phosphatase family protein [Kocuria sp. CPCC 205268]|uniref:endonuclease/exonuclease/phosphatase family protein n=1 Tax=Kocuria oxytropis TaxID=3058913 RepID=UPI0034D77A24